MTINDHRSLTRRRDLRNNATPEERILWNYLRQSKTTFKFKRQASIGYYITDFYCPSLRYVIELDGVQHIENKEYDKQRDIYLVSQGCFVRRFGNNEVNGDLPNVLNTIYNDLRNLNTTPARYSRHPSFK